MPPTIEADREEQIRENYRFAREEEEKWHTPGFSYCNSVTGHDGIINTAASVTELQALLSAAEQSTPIFEGKPVPALSPFPGYRVFSRFKRGTSEVENVAHYCHKCEKILVGSPMFEYEQLEGGMLGEHRVWVRCRKGHTIDIMILD